MAAAYSTGWYDFWNNFSGNYLFIISAGIGAIAYIYFAKIDFVRLKYLNASSDVRLGRWFNKYACIIAGPVMIIVMINSLIPFLKVRDVTYAKTIVEKTLTQPTIITLLLVIVLVFGGTCLMLYKCITTSERTEEEIHEYELANGVADEQLEAVRMK